MRGEKDLFSIIVPVYNVEKYLDKCLESILRQTFKDFECIIIDDGSPDNSNIIIDKYVKLDQRFKVIHQKNMGLSAARNTGLDIAQRNYIVFVDSDDYIADEYLEKFALKIADTDADIVICGFVEAYKDYEKNKVFAVESTEVIKQNILADVWPSYIWNKCYKKDLFGDIRFPIGRVYEDLLTIPAVCLNAKRIECIPDKLYYYNRQNVNSITAQKTVKNLYDLFLGRMKNRRLAVARNIDCLKVMDKIIVKETMKCLFRNCCDNKLSASQEQEMCDYLKERLDKSEVVGLRNKFWVKMLLKKRKKLCAWYARYRGYC